MKIVFLAPFGIRPKGTVIARMVPLAFELQRLGHEVTIIAPPYTNPEDSGKTETVRGVQLRNVVLPAVKSRALAVPPLAWRMFRLALAEKPDLVHLFKPKGYGGVAAMLHILLRQGGLRLAPLLVDTDDWEGDGGMNELHSYSGAEKRFYRFQERWLLRHAAGVTAASRALEDLVAGCGIATERVLYLPNSVNEGVAEPVPGLRGRLGIAEDAPVVLLYTRFFEFSQEKLHHLFARLYQQVPRVRFLVVGKGRLGEEDRLKAAARSGGYEEALVMAGWVDPAEIPAYLAAGDVAIYPFGDNLVNRTKCPAKLTELLLAGRAVVGDRVGQLAEYIQEERTGILCDPDDWDEMVARTVELLNDPQLRRNLGEAGRKHLLERFNWTDTAAGLNGFYESMRKGISAKSQRR